MAELKPNTYLFAGRYKIEALSGTDEFGYIYRAIDLSDGNTVEIHEFFPDKMCRRDEATGEMSILKASAAEASALYKKFSTYVTNLRDGLVKDGPALIHAFKDKGTAFYVVGSSAPAQPQHAHSAPSSSFAHAYDSAIAPAEAPAREPRPEIRESSAKKIASYRYAILWYRIVIGLLVAIVALLVYLTFFCDSPKVKSAASAPPDPAPAMTVAADSTSVVPQ